MSWSYTGNPATSIVDQIRHRLGDTDPANPMVSDEECLFAYEEERHNSYLAAAALAEQRALYFLGRPTSVRRGERMTSWDDQVQRFQLIAKTLRLQASLRTTTVYAGGISLPEKKTEEERGDRVKPFARKHLHDFPSLTTPVNDDL